MWLRRFSTFLLQQPLQGLLLTLCVSFVPLIGMIGIVFAAFVTLCKNIVEGAWFTLVATISLALSIYCFTKVPPETTPIILWVAIAAAVACNVLTYVFAVMLRKQASMSVILQVATLIGVLFISVVHLVYPGIADWWGMQLQPIAEHAQAMVQNAAPGSEARIQAININKYYVTGAVVATLLLQAVLQCIVARWWQAIVYKPGLLQYELHRIRLSQLAGILFILSLFLAYWGNPVVLDIIPVLYTLFAAAGLSVIHYFFKIVPSKTSWFWLSLMYLIIFFSLSTSCLLLAMIALLDIWLDLRKRFKFIT
jgi:hypothetical protein